MSLIQYLAQLIIPINLMAALLLIATLFFILKRRKLALSIAILGVGWALFWSLPIASMWLGGHLENQYDSVIAEQAPTADAIVVLGGHTANNRVNWFDTSENPPTRSRIERATELYHANRASAIVVSGAALDRGTSEAQLMARYLRHNHVDETDILLEENSFTTKENALFTAQLLKKKGLHRILLVTSALHMPRSVAAFEKEGIEVIAAPLPPQVIPLTASWRSLWQPSMRAMNASRSIIKEYAGLMVYWIRRWI